MRSLLLASAAVLIISQAALAQTPSTTNDTANQAQTNTGQQHMRSNIRNMLEKAGYKDIRVAPTSFAVRAKDSDGNPVFMSVSPDQFTEVTDVNGANGSTTGSANNPGGASERFVSVPNGDELSSKV